MSRNQKIIIGAVGFVVVFFVLVFLGWIPGLRNNNGLNSGKKVELAFWGVADSVVMQNVIEYYQEYHQNVVVFYTQFDESNYEKKLIDAMAAGESPDILMFRNHWLVKHGGKIVSAPTDKISLTQFRNLFPKVVEQDFVDNNNIYSLPLYIDTLVFIYNKDIFDAKSIAIPPRTWSEFQSLVPRLREMSALGKINKSAGAIGGSEKSINTASDLLNLIMMQLTNQQGEIDFERAALEALNFYTQFSDATNGSYTWNDGLGNSRETFGAGKTAVIFDYSSTVFNLKDKNPFLDIGVSEMLQPSDNGDSMNYADYYGLSVSNQSKNARTAWDFILSFTTDPSLSESYLINSHQPPALRSLIQKYSNDSDIGIFAKQALTARSWQQPDGEAVKTIFSEMIKAVTSRRLSVRDAINQAYQEIKNMR